MLDRRSHTRALPLALEPFLCLNCQTLRPLRICRRKAEMLAELSLQVRIDLFDGRARLQHPERRAKHAIVLISRQGLCEPNRVPSKCKIAKLAPSLTRLLFRESHGPTSSPGATQPLFKPTRSTALA